MHNRLLCTGAMSELQFKFGVPEHGWMDLSIADGEREVVMVISDVPCNSVCKLADTLLSLQSGSKIEEVEFSLEPDFGLWKFIDIGRELEINVFPGSGRDKPNVFKGERIKVIYRLYKALRDLESLKCWKDPQAIRNTWSWAFPSKELNQFKARAKSA